MRQLEDGGRVADQGYLADSECQVNEASLVIESAPLNATRYDLPGRRLLRRRRARHDEIRESLESSTRAAQPRYTCVGPVLSVEVKYIPDKDHKFRNDRHGVRHEGSGHN